MSDKFIWCLPLVRIGASVMTGDAFSATIQLFSEIKAGLDSSSITSRIGKLEDPIANIHPDVLNVSSVLYKAMCNKDSKNIQLREDVFDKYRRSLLMLEAKGLIEHHNECGTSYPYATTVSDPYYCIYMAAINDKNKELNSIVEFMENAQLGEWLNGDVIATQVSCPIFLVDAFFTLWESQGLGHKSSNQGEYRYLVIA